MRRLLLILKRLAMRTSIFCFGVRTKGSPSLFRNYRPSPRWRQRRLPPKVNIENIVSSKLSIYEAGIAELLSLQPGQLTTELVRSKILNVLLARDELASLLVNRRAVNAQRLDMIGGLDQQLRTNARSIVQLSGSGTKLKEWRDVVEAPPQAWWWFLDDWSGALPGGGTGLIATRYPQLAQVAQPISTGLAVLLFTISLALILEIAFRFLAIEPDIFGILTLLATLLAGGAIFRVREQSGERLPAHLSVPPLLESARKVFHALVLLSILLVSRMLLPSFAPIFNSWGVTDQETGNLTSSISNYRRAISLDPTYAQAHYNLANAYEDISEPEDALSEYKKALLADPQFYSAYNNLARLYITDKGEFNSALTLLNPAVERVTVPVITADQEQVAYTLFKNRGWVHLRLEYWIAAEADLRQALALRPNGSAARCLLAQVLESQGNPRADQKAALAEWMGCIRYANEDPVKPEAAWLSLARERIR
jgi:tetratricopeptide (TPR) repeat protein